MVGVLEWGDGVFGTAEGYLLEWNALVKLMFD